VIKKVPKGLNCYYLRAKYGGDVGSKTTCEIVCERSKRFKDYIPMASRKPVWGVVEKCYFRNSPALANLKSSLNLLLPFSQFIHLRF
jgi:hypothetical protein